LIDEYEAALPPGGWPNWVLGNHDRPRIASRIGTDQARIAAMLLLTLRGTPTIYYGDEIGMKEMPIAPDQACDPLASDAAGRGLGRDGCRTPMQWDATTYTGFSTAEPWLPTDRTSDRNNVANQRHDKASIYQLYRCLIALRRTRTPLLVGHYRMVLAEGNLLLFVREFGNERILVALNFGDAPAVANFVSDELVGRLLLSSAGDRQDKVVRGSINLRAHEGAIVELLSA
jgi:alpha-glucosidase